MIFLNEREAKTKERIYMNKRGREKRSSGKKRRKQRKKEKKQRKKYIYIGRALFFRWPCPSGHFCPPRLHKLWNACVANKSDWQDYYDDHLDGFASNHQSADEAFAHSDSDLAENKVRSEEEAAAGPVEPSQVEPCPEKDAAEFITLDSVRNRSFDRQVVASESSA